MSCPHNESGENLHARTRPLRRPCRCLHGWPFRHYHADADEIQLILDGAGSFWLADREVEVKAGDFIIIPRGTPHAGSRATIGRFRALATKLPPQRAGDTVPVP
jgi:mannose-6-phosphate isomerase-like protein (cupin superfamily)